MYYPYFRGKQFELITIRESALTLAQSNFVPIIEPVKETLRGLERTLDSVCEASGEAIVVVNPYYGDHQEDSTGISSLLSENYLDKSSISAGILLKEDMTVNQALAFYDQHRDHSPTFIHAGFTEAKSLAKELGGELKGSRNIFFEVYCGKLYRKHFYESTRVLIRDGFKRRRNADHPILEEFSDLHATYTEEGMDGFGDFLIVGDDYSEAGGPAYAIAIHLTFIDQDKDDAMFIYHFVSDTKDTPADPAGKFSEALEKLIVKLDSGHSKLLDTASIEEFKQLHDRGHFPGLGYVKKLSMNHHIETLSKYFSE